MSRLPKAKLPKEVNGLITVCRTVIAVIDEQMKKPSTEERGKIIAQCMTALAWQTDWVEHFGIKGWPCASKDASKPRSGVSQKEVPKP